MVSRLPSWQDAAGLLDGTVTVKALVAKQLGRYAPDDHDIDKACDWNAWHWQQSSRAGWDRLPAAIRCRQFAQWLRQLADAVFPEPEEVDDDA